ncbi:MAG: hypothetical protein Q8R25_00420 [bacterium]|nr:hypothetical protein [bacterium]
MTEIRDWEAAARTHGWIDEGPGTKIYHPDHPNKEYYTWRQCCLAEGITIEEEPRDQGFGYLDH